MELGSNRGKNARNTYPRTPNAHTRIGAGNFCNICNNINF
jgi:hypothetical protein